MPRSHGSSTACATDRRCPQELSSVPRPASRRSIMTVSAAPSGGALVSGGPSVAKGWRRCERPRRGVMSQTINTDTPAKLWSVQEVSEYLGVPVGTIYQWRVRSEGPPAMRLEKHLRFDPESVARPDGEAAEEVVRAQGRRSAGSSRCRRPPIAGSSSTRSPRS
ncbi:MAG: helix-turn-helix domain-containing protein [Nocardioides sp.]